MRLLMRFLMRLLMGLLISNLLGSLKTYLTFEVPHAAPTVLAKTVLQIRRCAVDAQQFPNRQTRVRVGARVDVAVPGQASLQPRLA